MGKLYSYLTVFLMIFIISLPVYANQQWKLITLDKLSGHSDPLKDIRPGADRTRPIHYIQFAKNNKPITGKIKLVFSKNTLTTTFCASSRSAVGISANDLNQVGYNPGDRVIIKIAQCADVKCLRTSIIGADTFTYREQNETYLTKPAIYNTHLDVNYPSKC